VHGVIRLHRAHGRLNASCEGPLFKRPRPASTLALWKDGTCRESGWYAARTHAACIKRDEGQEAACPSFH
jgi:hypothetical protein